MQAGFTKSMIVRITELSLNFSKKIATASVSVARAGTDTSRYNGTEYPASVFDIAWLGEGRTKPHAVGLLKPNAFGLYDMYGNVDEYCLDYYAEDATYATVGSSVVAPKGPTQGTDRVIRGTGSWWSASGDQARSAFRQSYTASGPWMCVGYRLVCLP